MESPSPSEGGTFSGFLLLTGGQESKKDILEGSFGFLHQRSTLQPEDLGHFTRMQALIRARGNVEQAEKFLKRMAEEPGTLSRTFFHERGETISTEFFKFLVQHRGLTGYRIRHFIFYRSALHLSPYITDKLQLRYDLRKVPNQQLLRELLKLLLNGCVFGGVEEAT
jgi:hypothetical protein